LTVSKLIIALPQHRRRNTNTDVSSFSIIPLPQYRYRFRTTASSFSVENMSSISTLPHDHELEEGELIEEAFFSGNPHKPQNAPNVSSKSAKNMEPGSKKGAALFKRKTPTANGTAVVKRKRATSLAVDEEDEDGDPGPTAKRNRSTNYVRSEDEHVSDSAPVDDDVTDNTPVTNASTDSAPSKKAPIKRAPVTKTPFNDNNPNSLFNNFIDRTNDSDDEQEQNSPPSKHTRSKAIMPSKAKGHLEPPQISQYRNASSGTESAFQQKLKRPRNDTLETNDEAEDGSGLSKRARTNEFDDEVYEEAASDSAIEVEYEETPAPECEHDDTTTNPHNNMSAFQTARLAQKRKISELLHPYTATISTEEQKDTAVAASPPPKKQKLRPGKQARKPAPPPPIKEKDEPFRFLALDADVRLMIYDLLFFPKGRKIRRPSIHVAGKKFNRPRIETALMRTSRALHTETHEYLTKRAHITLPLTKRKNVGYQLQQPDLMALLAYRHVTLEAWVKKPLEYKPRDRFDGSPTLGDTKLGRAFQELVPWLRGFQMMYKPDLKKNESLLAKKQIWVDLCPMYDMGANDEEKYEKERRAFVSTWRHEVLKGHAPGIAIRRVSRMGKVVGEAKKDEESEQ
jgi:hypothetical protein